MKLDESLNEISGHRVTRHRVTEGPNTYWYYTCECGFTSRKRLSISGARAVIDADHLVGLDSRLRGNDKVGFVENFTAQDIMEGRV